MRIIILALIFFPVAVQAALSEDGIWELLINGEDRLEFGTEFLAGGVQIHWRSNLRFEIRQGQFVRGSGTAELNSEVEPFSRPSGRFDCALQQGVFASKNGISFKMPHLRYRSFPVSGTVSGSTIELQPDFDYPGNYYAILYACETLDESGVFWLQSGERFARELGKRQSSITQVDQELFKVSVKEVKPIEPGETLSVPLQNGLQFDFSSEAEGRQLKYHLQKVAE